MSERKSKIEYDMMIQVTRIIMLPNTNFDALCKNLDRGKMREISDVLNEARERNKQLIPGENTCCMACCK